MFAPKFLTNNTSTYYLMYLTITQRQNVVKYFLGQNFFAKIQKKAGSRKTYKPESQNFLNPGLAKP